MNYLGFCTTKITANILAAPYDAYSVQYNWVTPRYLAIDQGTIAPMVENYRSAFCGNYL
jgi:hypothetical protein